MKNDATDFLEIIGKTQHSKNIEYTSNQRPYSKSDVAVHSVVCPPGNFWL